MASNFHIQKPYVLATLPRPLDRANGPGHYVCGEVFGQQQGSKKRKRSEICIGIDGDAVNIYDVSSARLITSYPIPPQSSFTCTPCSIRWRSSMSKDIARHTYVSTRESQLSDNKVTLFKDILRGSGATASTSISKSFTTAEPIVHLSTTSLTDSNPSLLNEAGPNLDVLAVLGDGGVLCLRGETLEEKWRTPPSILLQGQPGAADGRTRVEHAQFALAADVVDGIFGGKADAFSAFPQKIQRDAFNPDVLLLITQPEGTPGSSRHLHVLAIPRLSDTEALGRPKVVQVHVVPLPDRREGGSGSSWQLAILSGRLQEERGSTIFTYDLTGSLPKLQSSLEVPAMESFLSLSDSSVLVSTPGSLAVYNPIYQSLHATTKLEVLSRQQEASIVDGHEDPCMFITYLARLSIALFLSGPFVVAVQLEAPQTRGRKRRAEGLLIDSVGRGIPGPVGREREPNLPNESSVFTGYLAGSMSDTYWSKWTADVETAEEYLSNHDLVGFEKLMAERLGIKLSWEKHSDDDLQQGEDAGHDVRQMTRMHWAWPESREDYPQVDRRWILFAISKIFSWQESESGDHEGSRLSCQLPESNVLNYLVDTGSLTVSNLRTALRDQLGDAEDAELRLAEQLPQQLVDADATMALLLVYINATKLGPTELLIAIRLIMYSLELIRDPAKPSHRLLPSVTEGQEQEHGHGQDKTREVDEPGVIGMELDLLEHELEVTEYYAGDETGIRARGLSAAFAKLGTCAAAATVRALRAVYRPEETLSLIHVLRMELIKDGWTTRYQDEARVDEADEPPPDGSIRLLADLLCRCIDSVGPAGWLVNDAILARSGDHLDSAEFLASLKLEVSAALEGIQEAVYLRGLLSEAVRYGHGVQKALATAGDRGKQRQQGTGTVLGAVVPTAGKGKGAGLQQQQGGAPAKPASTQHMLPLGLKARQRVSPEKIVSGGEIVQRSRRERGHLASKNVGPYSLERIVL